MPSDWYVVIDGKKCGPLDDSRIKALVSEGWITSETQVCRAGMKQWVPARQIKGLFSASQMPAPPVADDALNFAPVSVSPRRPGARSAAKPDCTINILLGCSGAAAMLLGFFCPILRLPIIGNMSYLGFVGLLLRSGAVSEMTISAFLVVAAVVIAIVAAIAKHPPLFWIPGIAGCLSTLLTLGKYFWIQAQMSSTLKRDLDGNPFAGLAQAMAQAVSLDFGIGIIVIGVALIIAGAAVPAAKRG